jgi:hypothetical protein
MYYKFTKKENFKAWSLSIGIYLAIFIILLLAGASCSSPSKQYAAAPEEKFVVLSVKEITAGPKNDQYIKDVYRLKRLTNNTVVNSSLNTFAYYEVGDTISMKYFDYK